MTILEAKNQILSLSAQLKRYDLSKPAKLLVLLNKLACDEVFNAIIIPILEGKK